MYAKTILLALLLTFCGLAHGQEEIDVTAKIENVSELIGMSIIIGYNSNAVEVVDTDTALVGTQVNIINLQFLTNSTLMAGIKIDKYNNENPGTLIIGYSSVPPVFNSGTGNCFVLKFRRISEEEDSIRFIVDKCKLRSILYEIPAEWWNSDPPYPSDTTRVILTKVITGIEDNNNIITTNKLYQSYPNPSNAGTTIEFSIKTSSIVELSIYDNLGRKIRTVINKKKMSMGKHKIRIRTHNMASGMYFYMLKTDKGFKDYKKMILVK